MKTNRTNFDLLWQLMKSVEQMQFLADNPRFDLGTLKFRDAYRERNYLLAEILERMENNV